MDWHSNNRLIVKNSAFLFFRTLFVMFVTLYASRIVLETLGVDDYGIYNVVAGIVSMLTFLNSAMVQASQRYITFAIGRNDYSYRIDVFSASLLIHISIAICVLLCMETIGFWYVNNVVVLPANRLFAANIIFQFAVLSFIFKILVVPFQAHVIAHEKMSVYAYISIADVLIQLVAIICLKKYIFGDKLILYGACILGISIFMFIAYFIYCKKYFRECTFSTPPGRSLFHEMFKFAGWAFLGGFGFVASGQGVNLVVNYFCGPAINAARAVAYQASAGIDSFVASFQQAINPQITKRYASGNTDSMMRLVQFGSKCTFALLLMLCAPIIVRPGFVLGVWLRQVPDYASQFLVLSLIVNMISSLGGPLNTAMQATGRIKVFQITVALIMCCDIPFAFILLKRGIAPYLVVCVTIVTTLICVIMKILLLNKLVQFEIKKFLFSGVVLNILLATIILIIEYYVSAYINQNVLGFLFLCLLSIILTICFGYFMTFSVSERNYVVTTLQGMKNRFVK